MKISKDHIIGIQNIISRIQEEYPNVNLGNYVEHFICEYNTYKVVLDNNTTIKIHRTTAQDAEISVDFVDDDSLNRIINSIEQFQ